ncbi:DUF4296 domain-containing protein [Sabulilitoribacter arenilitoris]|uniref:DUF4296 domain-containing protein n=1 Tax=Wocania arenilitoris TaxID=2044858 RepID=A0AAE3EPV5_9FLAO|nr:DUF4296 domain-containing protein [Wocania arenilitoris]MCF7568397.1 DUF4296 domain-containing protein [Wocania arenilitoris]
MILKRFLTYFSLVLLATACYKYNKPKKPKNLIPKDKMVNIIIDVRLLASANGKNKRTLEENNLQSEAYIYKKYNIDSLQFALSNNYYAYYVDDYIDIYEKVKDSLGSLNDKFSDLAEKEEQEKKYKDSINSIIKKDSIRILKIKNYISALVKKDSLKPLIKKDSIRLIKLKDSLQILVKKDSLEKINLKTPVEEGLITPVSDIDFQ